MFRFDEIDFCFDDKMISSFVGSTDKSSDFLIYNLL